MTLLTKENLQDLPALYSQEDKSNKEIKIRVKFFLPGTACYWYATEYRPEEKLFFGYCEVLPGGGELGYFTLADLESVKNRFGVKVERDRHFGEHFLQEVIDGARP